MKDTLEYINPKVNSHRYKEYHQSYFGKTQSNLHLPKLHEKDELNKLWSEVPLE